MNLHPHSSSPSSVSSVSVSDDQNTPAGASAGDLIQVFNTALLSSKAVSHDYLSELCHVLDTAAFRAILSSIKSLSKSEGLTEKEAAESVIRAFRKLDALWSDYVFQQGLTQLKSQMAQSERTGPLGPQS
jgi:hypothetical protein